MWPIDKERSDKGSGGSHGISRHWLKCGISVVQIPQKKKEQIDVARSFSLLEPVLVRSYMGE